MTIWKHIAILVPILLLFVLIMVYTSTEPPEVIKRDIPLEMYKEIEDYIIPEHAGISYICNEVLGINWDDNVTSTDIALFQEWISKNVDFRDVPLKYPNEVLRDKVGNHLSLSLLEYSMILQQNSTIDSFVILVDLMYDGDTEFRGHSATLTFFNDMVFLSDPTIPEDKIGYVCRLNRPNKVLPDIIDNTYVTRYEINFALSEKENYQFRDSREVYEWMLFKCGYT